MLLGRAQSDERLKILSLLSNEILKKLKDIEELEVLHDTDLSKFSTMKLSCHGDLLKVSSVNALMKVITIFKENKISYKLIGWGANLILPENPNFIFIKLDLPFDKSQITAELSEFKLSATAPLNVLTSLATKYGFKGWEVFTGIPASLGGAVFMNAGTNLGEICEVVKDVTLLRSNGQIEVIKTDESSFSYRKNHFVNDGDVIVEVTLIHKGIDPNIGPLIKDYLKKRTESQPLREKTCGCMFKNQSIEVSGESVTCRAGLYLDIIGLKGLSKGQMRISPRHANFMENRGSCSSEDVKQLVDNTLRELEFHYGVKFETEVDLP